MGRTKEGLLQKTKTEAPAIAPRRREVDDAVGGGAEVGAEVPAAAAQNAVMVAFIYGVALVIITVGVGFVFRETPFPHISTHIINAELVRELQANGFCFAVAIFSIPAYFL